MTEQKKDEQETPCGPMLDPASMKAFRAMLEEADSDCVQMMSRLRAVCCGRPEQSEEREESMKGKKV